MENFKKLYANLHMHSIHSDGEFTPTELVAMARGEGYGAVALTDHDAMSGIEEYTDACKRMCMEYITGIEFTCVGDDHFHITGLDFDINDKGIREYCRLMAERETFRTKTLFDIDIEKGIIEGIDWEDVKRANPGVEWLCVDHVFRTLLKKGDVTMKDYDNFRKTAFGYGPENQFVYDIMPSRIWEVHEVIELINNAGGIATIAHPKNQLQFVPDLVKMGLKGIEVWHPDLNDEDSYEAEKIAKKYNLYISGGTDHHGLLGGMDRFDPDGKLRPPFNIPSQKYGTSEENFRAIKDRIYG